MIAERLGATFDVSKICTEPLVPGQTSHSQVALGGTVTEDGGGGHLGHLVAQHGICSVSKLCIDPLVLSWIPQSVMAMGA